MQVVPDPPPPPYLAFGRFQRLRIVNGQLPQRIDGFLFRPS